MIDETDAGIDVGLFAAPVDSIVDIGRHLAPYDGANEAHEALGLAKGTAPNGSNDDQEDIVNLVVQLLAAEPAAEIESYPAGEDLIEFGRGLWVAPADTADEFRPVYIW